MGDIRAAVVDFRAELLRRARRLVGPAAAEDLVQEATVRALESEASFEGGNARAWLHRVLFNHFATAYRRRELEREVRAELTAGADELEPAPAPALGFSPAVARALDALPAPFREAVLLVDVGDWTGAEVAAWQGVARATVNTRVFRGRRMLAQQLEEPCRSAA